MKKIVFLLFLLPLVACSYKSTVSIREGKTFSIKRASLHYQYTFIFSEIVSEKVHGLFREYNYLDSSESGENNKNDLFINDKKYTSLSKEKKKSYRRIEDKDKKNYYVQEGEVWIRKYPIFDAYSYCVDKGGEVGSFSLETYYVNLTLRGWRHERETFITCVR